MRKLSYIRTLGVSLAGLGIALASSAVPIGTAVVGGLLQFDYVDFSGDKEGVVRSSGDVRRADIWIKGDLPKEWSYQLGYDARYNLLNASWIGYDGFDYFWLAMGYIDVPQSIQYWSSYTYETFMEYASPVTAFTPHKGIGLYADGLAFQDMFSYQGAFYSPDIYTEETVQVRTRSADIGNDSDQWGIAARGVVRPKLGLGDILHIGASGRFEGVSETDTLNALVTTPGLLGRTNESDRTNIFVSTVTPTEGDVNNVTVFGAELADVWGPFTAQGEYIYNKWTGATDVSSLSFSGWYAQLAYVITGESRSYDKYNGTIGNVENINNDYGAWELAVRYASTDLSDNPDEGYDVNDKRGSQKDWALGVNWYIIENVKLQANFTYANAEYETEGVNDAHIKGMGIRAQVDF
ncbi:MAG: OprO/OprP family phosphate-selective porin [Gammaproteobacteria bacterium]